MEGATGLITEGVGADNVVIRDLGRRQGVGVEGYLVHAAQPRCIGREASVGHTANRAVGAVVRKVTRGSDKLRKHQRAVDVEVLIGSIECPHQMSPLHRHDVFRIEEAAVFHVKQPWLGLPRPRRLAQKPAGGIAISPHCHIRPNMPMMDK